MDRDITPLVVAQMEARLSDLKREVERARSLYADQRVVHDNLKRAIHNLTIVNKGVNSILMELSSLIVARDEDISSMTMGIRVAKEEIARQDEEDCLAREEERHEKEG